MNILVLGGSYFLGKHFINISKNEHSITVFNRGSRPLRCEDVEELCGDRHNKADLETLCSKHFDAVVDFCAYEKRDIETVFEVLSGQFTQYIFVSTCDVYEHGTGKIMDEQASFEIRQFAGEAGQYITGKTILERELYDCAAKYDVAYTSIRPAIIYGPDNYAPRESVYFKWIENAGQVLHPVDATGEFQMVYVLDVARALLNSIGNKQAYNRAYNLTPLPMVTYESFYEALEKAVDKPFDKVQISCAVIYERQIPLPFPLHLEESNRYEGEAVKELIGDYTPLEDGLRQTYEDYKKGGEL